MINEHLFTSNTNEWATPQKLFDELNEEFHFTLDPCSTDENAKCEKHYTIKEDGLKQSWGGRLFIATHLMEHKLRIGLERLGKKALSLTQS